MRTAPSGQLYREQILEYAGQAEPVERRANGHRRIVNDNLTLNAHVQFADALLRLPWTEPAPTRQAEVGAAMLRQVLRRPGLRVPDKVEWRAYDRHPKVGTGPDGNHVLTIDLPQPDAGIEAFGNEVSQTGSIENSPM